MTTKTEDKQKKEQAMFRSTRLVALAAFGLTTWGAAESFAHGPQLSLRPQGLLVTQVIPGSTAAMQGIEAGDIIVSVNGSLVRSLNDLHYGIGRAGGVAALGVIDWRTGWQNAVTVYPQWGRIGVYGRPTQLDAVRPMPQVYPLWGWGHRPLPLPLPGPGQHVGR